MYEVAELQKLEDEIRTQITTCCDQSALEMVRVATLGKKGCISQKMKTLGTMPPEERKSIGPALNELKRAISTAIGEQQKILREAETLSRLAQETLDVTLPVRPLSCTSGTHSSD